MNIARREKFEVKNTNIEKHVYYLYDTDGNLCLKKDSVWFWDIKLLEDLGFKVEEKTINEPIYGTRYYFTFNYDKALQYINKRIDFLKQQAEMLIDKHQKEIKKLHDLEIWTYKV